MPAKIFSTKPFKRLTVIAAAAALTLLAGSSLEPGGALASQGAKTQVVGGYYPSSPWPWMVSVQHNHINGNDYQQHFCGGALIHARLVVTAAHCIVDDAGRLRTATSNLGVLLGKTHLPSAGGEHIAVSGLEIHPQYSGQTLAYDMALLYLDRGSAHKPATILSTSTRLYEGNIARVMGWGNTRPGENGGNSSLASEHLKGIDLAIWSSDRCAGAGQNTTDQAFYRNYFSSASMICAAYRADSPDATCNGDSGGPMMVYDAQHNWYLTGLVSWGGFGCTGYYSPTVFTWLQNSSMSQMMMQGLARAEAMAATPKTERTDPGAGGGSGTGGGETTPSIPKATKSSPQLSWLYASMRRTQARVGRRLTLALRSSGYPRVRVTYKRGARRIATRVIRPHVSTTRIAVPTAVGAGPIRVRVVATNPQSGKRVVRTLRYRLFR